MDVKVIEYAGILLNSMLNAGPKNMASVLGVLLHFGIRTAVISPDMSRRCSCSFQSMRVT
jgi:hypothetical protein